MLCVQEKLEEQRVSLQESWGPFLNNNNNRPMMVSVAPWHQAWTLKYIAAIVACGQREVKAHKGHTEVPGESQACLQESHNHFPWNSPRILEPYWRTGSAEALGQESLSYPSKSKHTTWILLPLKDSTNVWVCSCGWPRATTSFQSVKP